MRLGSLREMNKWKFKELEPSSRIIRQGLWIPTKEIKKNEKKMKKKKVRLQQGNKVDVLLPRGYTRKQ